MLSICALYYHVGLVSSFGLKADGSGQQHHSVCPTWKKPPFFLKQSAPYSSDLCKIMKSVRIDNKVLSVVDDTPVPQLKEGDVLIKVTILYLTRHRVMSL